MLKHVLAMDSDKICEASMYVLPKTLQTPHNLFGQSAKIGQNDWNIIEKPLSVVHSPWTGAKYPGP